MVDGRPRGYIRKYKCHVFVSVKWHIKAKFRAYVRQVGKIGGTFLNDDYRSSSGLSNTLEKCFRAKHEVVEIPASKEKIEISRILKEEGFIRDYHVSEGAKPSITLVLKYGANNEKVITGLRRISKPGMRVYAKVDSIPRVLNGLGIAIISTSEGLVTDKQARQKHIGGEVLAYVW